ncbi:tein kinase 4-like protein [Phlyctema vagabunda]|uniref:Tein kinase 4-like protein n=1 Tax=Phlyctema vagabunda TaxID=108571 RepID=A0ABR4PP72_9HELO
MDLGRDQPNWEPSIQRFLDFVRRNCELEVVQPRDTAEGIAEETRPFMPKQVIEKYFTDNRFREFKETYSALFPSSHDHCDPRRVLNKYTAVFCTLLQAGRGPYIKHFLQHHSLSDTALPFSLENPPANLPITPGDPNFLSDICNQQWRFCAPVFDSILNTNFESERVLPITSKTRLAGGGTAALWLIKLRDGYNNLSKAPRNTSNLFVLKEYSTNDAQKYYDNETAAFDKIKAHPHIIGYYGCFRRGGTFNVLLEYADKGTLKQFFERQAPPLGYPGLINFWKGQFNLIDALRAIHEVTPFSGDGPRIFQG